MTDTQQLMKLTKNKLVSEVFNLRNQVLLARLRKITYTDAQVNELINAELKKVKDDHEAEIRQITKFNNDARVKHTEENDLLRDSISKRNELIKNLSAYIAGV